MSTRFSIAAIGLVGVLCGTGCVMPDQLSQIQKDLADVRTQLDTLRKEQSVARRQLDALDGQNRRNPGFEPGEVPTRAQVADIDVRVHQSLRNSEINEERLGDLQRQVERIARELGETRDMAQSGDRRLSPVYGATGQGDPGDAFGTGPSTTGRLPTGGGTPANPDELYNTSYADFSKGNYDLAISGFEDFFDLYPQSAVADNALYWIGECYFSQGDFPLAIRAFDRMLSTFPDSDKAAAGNLKKGLAYLEQNQVRQAIVQLQHVHTAFAGSDEARVARDKLTALGVPI